jgi:hypothetical protein
MDVRAERLYPSAHFTISQAAVAQWIEYWPPKPRVVGSIPASRTIPFSRFSGVVRYQYFNFINMLQI